MTRRRHLAVAVALFALAGACFTPRKAAPLPEVPSSTQTYVAVGGNESIGVGTEVPLRDSYAQVFFREALPVGTVFVNVAVPDALAASALEREVPEAAALTPTFVTVLLGADDIVAGTDPTTFAEAMGRLVHGLRGDGRTKVLVGNVTRLAALPANQVDVYNSSIAGICAAEGAQLVDLHAIEVATADGRYPNVAGHAAIAAAFTKALRSAQA